MRDRQQQSAFYEGGIHLKIAKVEAIRADRYCYARVTTDTGLTGIGESGAFGALEASAAQINNFASFLVGKDPLDIEHLWQAMFRGFFFRGSAVMGAISAIDVALWDIAGKYYGVPIYKLCSCCSCGVRLSLCGK